MYMPSTSPDMATYMHAKKSPRKSPANLKKWAKQAEISAKLRSVMRRLHMDDPRALRDIESIPSRPPQNDAERAGLKKRVDRNERNLKEYARWVAKTMDKDRQTFRKTFGV